MLALYDKLKKAPRGSSSHKQILIGLFLKLRKLGSKGIPHTMYSSCYLRLMRQKEYNSIDLSISLMLVSKFSPKLQPLG
jgi:hypothetical protein